MQFMFRAGGLWFDVEKKTITTLNKQLANNGSCGLM